MSRDNTPGDSAKLATYSWGESPDNDQEQGEPFPFDIESFEMNGQLVGKKISKATIELDQDQIQQIISQNNLNLYGSETGYDQPNNTFLLTLKIDGLDGVIAVATFKHDQYRAHFQGLIHIKNIEPSHIEPLGTVRRVHLNKEAYPGEGKGQKKYSKIRTEEGVSIEYGEFNADDQWYPHAFAEMTPSFLTDGGKREREQGMYELSEFILNDDVVGKELSEVTGIDSETMEDIYEEYTLKHPESALAPGGEGLIALKIEGVDGIIIGFAEKQDGKNSQFSRWIQVKNIEPPQTNPLGKIIYLIPADPDIDGFPAEINTERSRVEFGNSRWGRNKENLSGFAKID